MASDKKETVKSVEAEQPVVKAKKKVKRVWQSPKGPNAKVTLTTLHVVDIEHQRLKAHAEIAPNQAGQYVLLPSAQEHEIQLEAMETLAEKYGMYEIDPKMEGVLPTSYEGMELPEQSAEAVSSLKAELLKAQKANAELMKKLADAENAKVDA